MEVTVDYLQKLKESLNSFIACQELNDHQLEDIISHPDTGIFHKYDFHMFAYIQMHPQFLQFVINYPAKFIDYVQNALIAYQDGQFEHDPQQSNMFKEFLVVNFKEVPYSSQVYKFMEKSENRDPGISGETTFFLECKNLFYKLIMLQGEVVSVSNPKSMEKYRIYQCAVCNRGYLEENNWVIGKTRIRQSKIPSFVRNASVDDEHTDPFTGYLRSEKLKCICESKRLNSREKVLISYQEIVIRLKYLNQLTVLFEGNSSEHFNLGQRICVTGYLITHFDKLTKHGRCEGTISMYALKHDLVASIQHQVLTSEIMPEIPQPMQSIKNDILNKNRFIRSFCPKIKKKNYAKLFMLLALVSGTAYMRNNNEVRSQIHILFVGPSGSHKFDLMRAASSIVKECKFMPLSENLGTDFIFTMTKRQERTNFEVSSSDQGRRFSNGQQGYHVHARHQPDPL